MNLKGKFLLVITLTTGLLLAQDVRTILKNNIHLRQGPGCYYPLIKVLNIGDTVDVITKESGWANVNHLDTTGWIFDKCFSQPTNTGNTADNILLDNESTQISRITAGGAVKGFATKHYDGTPVDDNIIFRSYLNPYDYKKIKNSMAEYRLRDGKYKDLINEQPKDFHIDHKLNNIGDMVAKQIASKGLVKDKAQLSYLNAIGTLVLEETDLYYYPVKFFIVEDEHKAAYATPNGMVFVTKGLMDFVQNEAELACLLAHEISHIIYQHGYTELEKRKVTIQAESAFGDLDMEIDEDKSEEQLDLESLSTKFYENATAPRQMKYEYEADKMGVVFARKAGYDPSALPRLLTRLQKDTTIDYENFESNWEKAYIKDRIEKITKFINRNLSDSNVLNQDRFNSVF